MCRGFRLRKLEDVEKKNKVSFFGRLFFKNKEIKNLDFEPFKKRGLTSKVKESVGIEKRDQARYSSSIIGVIKILKDNPTLKDLKELEERFTSVSKSQNPVGSGASQERKSVVPSEYEDVNVLYMEIVQRIASQSKRKDQKKYIRKIHDIFYYDFNHYVKETWGSGFSNLLEYTDMINEQSSIINQSCSRVNVKKVGGAGGSLAPHGDADEQRKTDEENRAYKTPNIPTDTPYSPQVFTFKDLVDEMEYSKWLEDRRSESKTGNLYESRKKGFSFVGEVLEKFENSKQVVSELLVEEYVSSLKRNISPNLYDSLVSSVGVPKNRGDVDKFNERLFKIAYLGDRLSKEGKVLETLVEKIKRTKKEMDSLSEAVSKKAPGAERDALVEKLRGKAKDMHGSLVRVFGDAFVRARAKGVGGETTSGFRSDGLPSIARVSQNIDMVSPQNLLNDIQEAKSALSSFPKIAMEIVSLGGLSESKGKRSKIAIGKKIRLSGIIVENEKEPHHKGALRRAKPKSPAPKMEIRPEEEE